MGEVVKVVSGWCQKEFAFSDHRLFLTKQDGFRLGITDVLRAILKGARGHCFLCFTFDVCKRTTEAGGGLHFL